MNINQTKQSVQTILAKETLKLPLTDREKALLTLYGDRKPQTEAEIKAAFVATYLSPLLANADVGVAAAKYIVENGDEYVILTYEHTARQKRVCVSCDSLITIVTDVIDGVHGGGQWL